jgi:hypothetical protein
LSPYVHEFVRREVLGLGHEKEAFFDAAKDTFDLVRLFPGRLNALLRRIERNEIRFKVDMGGQRDRALRDERQGTRTAMTLIMGAVLVGIALVLGYRDIDILLTFLVLGSLIVLLWAFVMLYLAES